MKDLFGFILLALIAFITFGLPFSFFFASAFVLKLTLIFVGIAVLIFWAAFLAKLLEMLGEKHD